MRIVFYCPAEIKEIAEIIVTRPREVLSAISAGLLVSHADSFYCPTEIKEIKEILLPARCEALSAISAISVGHYYLMRIVFYCPTEIKEIKEIFIPLGEALSAISALSAGLLLYHATGFSTKEYFCPTERTERTEIFAPHCAKPFLPFLLFLRDIIILCG